MLRNIMDEPFQVPPKEPELGSLPSDWNPVPVEPLRVWITHMLARMYTPQRPPPTEPVAGIGIARGDGRGLMRMRPLVVRLGLLMGMAMKGVIVTDEIINAVATRPLSPDSVPEKIVETFVAEFS